MNDEKNRDVEFWEEIIKHCLLRIKQAECMHDVYFYSVEVNNAIYKLVEAKRKQIYEETM